MTSGNDGAPPRDGGAPDDEFSLVQVLNVFLRYRRLIVAVPLVLVAIVVVRAIGEAPPYVATASFMPQSAEARGGVSGTAALARQFGLSTGGGAGQSPQFYSRLLETREILWQAASSEYDLVREDGTTRRGTLVPAPREGETEREVKQRAIQGVRSRLSLSFSRDTGIVTVTVRDPSSALAEQIADRLIELVNEFNLESRQSQARAEGQFVEERLEEVQAELSEAEVALQTFLRQNRMFRNAPELVFEHDRLQRQVAMRQDMVNALTQAREQARIDAVRDTPVITVIEAADGSARPERGARMANQAMLGGVSGLALAILLAFFLEFVRRSRRDDRDAYREFHRLRHDTLEDLRRPGRVFRRQPVGARPPPEG